MHVHEHTLMLVRYEGEGELEVEEAQSHVHTWKLALVSRASCASSVPQDTSEVSQS